MEEKIVTLATYPNITEASIVHGRLMEQGIESFIVDTIAQVNPPGQDFGEVRLNIREEDAPKAISIINTIPSTM